MQKSAKKDKLYSNNAFLIHKMCFNKHYKKSLLKAKFVTIFTKKI